jgi:hypothetical protein
MRLQALSLYAMERLEEKRHNRSAAENGGRLQSCKTGNSNKKKHPKKITFADKKSTI